MRGCTILSRPQIFVGFAKKKVDVCILLKAEANTGSIAIQIEVLFF